MAKTKSRTKKKKSKGKPRRSVKKRRSTKRKPNAAFMRPVQPDDKLAAVVGPKPVPRSELTKKLWDYIKKNGLQDKKLRTQINADEPLRAVFNGKSQVNMFEMTKLVGLRISIGGAPGRLDSPGTTGGGPGGPRGISRGGGFRI
jgi:chromatin remodeling complex protein RSC6